MRSLAGIVLVFLLSGCQHALVPGSQTPAVKVNNNSAQVPLHEVSFAAVQQLEYTEANTTLQYGKQPLQFGKLWLPAHSNTPPPLVIFIHGGCWLSAYDIEHSYPLASALTQAGFAVWTVEYRRTGDLGGGWPGSLEDVVKSIDFIMSQDHNENIALNLQNVTLTGHSAGGHLALLASERLAKSVGRIIGLAPIVDIEAYAQGTNSCQRATIDFMEGTPQQRPEQYAQANPLHTLPAAKQLDNITILAGEQDSIVPIPDNPLPGAQFLRFEHTGHFDWVHPGTLAFSQFIEILKNK